MANHHEILSLFDKVQPWLPICTQVGSRVTCNPPPTDTDEDWLVLCDIDCTEQLQRNGFRQDGSPEFYTGNDDGGFRSWRRGELNLIVTKDQKFHLKFLTATDLARRFNLLDKSDRIALFQAVLYGVAYDNLQQRRKHIQVTQVAP